MRGRLLLGRVRAARGYTVDRERFEHLRDQAFDRLLGAHDEHAFQCGESHQSAGLEEVAGVVTVFCTGCTWARAIDIRPNGYLGRMRETVWRAF